MTRNTLSTYGNVLTSLKRKKSISESIEKTTLAKVLTTLDLTALGIGSTLGVGVYVLAGEVSLEIAGPAVVISFAIAAITSVLAGLSFAEFGARVPKAGSAYIYSYVTVGEFIAFLIGWNLILEYGIGSASVVKALSNYIDKLANNAIHGWFAENMPMKVEALGDYPDFFALALILVFSIGLALGAKESSVLNNIFTLTNLTVVVFVIIAGSLKADPSNWSIPIEDVPDGYGTGGFAPYGIAGIIKGAAICFYGFIGFDCIATAGEEAKNPKKSIPISIVVSLFIIFLAYFGISTVLTMMLPYYEQDPLTPLPHVFDTFGWNVAKQIVSYGAIFGLFSSLMGAMFPLPRVIYAMANDGLLFSIMGRIHPRFQTPVYGTLIAGCITGILAAIFNLNQLVNMMSIGTLLAYSIVAACVLLLRFECSPEDPQQPETDLNKSLTIKTFVQQCLHLKGHKYPTNFSSKLVVWLVTLYCCICFGSGAIISFLGNELLDVKWYALLPLILLVIIQIGMLFIVSRQPRSTKILAFSVPFLPWLPGISIFINIYLMLQLDYLTWIRFAVWMIIGLVVYFAYGIRNSKLKKN